MKAQHSSIGKGLHVGEHTVCADVASCLSPTYESRYIFEELMTGGDLFSFLQYKGGLLDEAGVGVIVRQVLEALKYLHDQDITHRDIKPENILLTSLADSARVVLTDFGSAMDLSSSRQSISKAKRMITTVGTTGYHAP